MVRYFDKLSIDRLTILSEVEGQIRITKIQTSKTKKAGENGGGKSEKKWGLKKGEKA